MASPDELFRYWRDVLGAPIRLKDGREMKMKDFWKEQFTPEVAEEFRKVYEEDSMVPEVDSYNIYHIDGIPASGFRLINGDNTFDVQYKTLAFLGRTLYEIQEAHYRILEMISKELVALTQNKFGSGDYPATYPIIWWRRRPEFSKDMERELWKFTCRLDTSPALPKAFWDKWSHPDGAEIRPVPEELKSGQVSES